MLNIVLLEPQIPQNTGNISRTCACTGSRLHLIKPLGFEISDRHLKRAGLDYWQHLDLSVYESIGEFYQKNQNANIYYLSTKAALNYCDAQYLPGDYFMFGKETKGLPESVIAENYSRSVRIPMLEGARSLNLSNAVAVVLFEGLRQLGFKGLLSKGHIPQER